MDNDIKQKTYEFIQRNGSITFAELEYLFEIWGYDWRGDIDITGNPSIIYWKGWNRELAIAITELFNEELISVIKADMIDILLGGKMLPLPLAKQPHRIYKTPHWLPVALVPNKTGGIKHGI